MVVGTFGESAWRDLAYSRAIPSVPEGVPVVHRHANTLAQARNEGLALVDTEFVLFLDADDALADGYCEAMSQAPADVRVPMLRFIQGRRERLWQPRVFAHDHDCVSECITSGAGNWCPAGTVARTELVREVGGWREYPVFEDFDLWMRVLLTGATIELVRDAIYQAWARPDSRNRAPAQEFKNRIHNEIVTTNLAEWGQRVRREGPLGHLVA